MGILDSAAKSVGNAGAALRDPFSRNTKVSLNGDDFPEGFRFEELTGPKALVVLAGSWMPKVPFTFGGEQRIVKEFYAGNEEPSVHILGSEESDITINGRFCDKKLPVQQDVDLYGVATEIQEKIDEIRKRGNVLRIWVGEWQRYGIITKTEWPMKSLGDLEYRITFSIFGFAAPRNYQFIEASKTIPLEVNEDLIAKAQIFQEMSSRIPESVPASLGDILRDGISNVASAVGAVTGFVNDVMSVAEDVTNSVARARGLIRHAQNEVLRFQRRIGQISYQFTAAIKPDQGARQNPTAARYEAIKAISGAMSQAAILAGILAEMQQRFAKISESLPLFRHRVIDGDSLQRLSMKFYGTPDNWKKIMDHNKLLSTELERGSILEIPRL
jgi:hypothetical protein